MLTGRKLVRCSTLMRSFGLLIKVIHLTQQKGLYFEMDVGWTDRIAVEKLHFRIETFYYISDARRFRCLNFQNWNARVAASMYIPDIYLLSSIPSFLFRDSNRPISAPFMIRYWICLLFLLHLLVLVNEFCMCPCHLNVNCTRKISELINYLI